MPSNGLQMLVLYVVPSMILDSAIYMYNAIKTTSGLLY